MTMPSFTVILDWIEKIATWFAELKEKFAQIEGEMPKEHFGEYETVIEVAE